MQADMLGLGWTWHTNSNTVSQPDRQGQAGGGTKHLAMACGRRMGRLGHCLCLVVEPCHGTSASICHGLETMGGGGGQTHYAYAWR